MRRTLFGKSAVEDGREAGEAPAEPELTPLPGSVRLASAMERRAFLRRAATSTFMGFVAVTSGSASLFGFLADPAAAAGPCCPSCCGPSPCCNTSCCSKPCCTPGSVTCANNGGTCRGKDFRDYTNSSCWSCTVTSSCTTTVCCDCVTNSTTGCSNSTNRCICYKVERACSQSEMQSIFAITGGNLKGQRG